MMKQTFTITSAFMTGFMLTACVAESGSQLHDNDVDIHPDVVQPAAAIKITCPENAMVFLLASSERMSRITSWKLSNPDRVQTEAAENSSAEDFASANAKAQADLETALARDPGCIDENASGGVRANLVFISVTDGNGTGDSKITSIHYGYEGNTWKRTNSRKWKYNNDRLTALRKSAPSPNGLPVSDTFELDMSRAATSIAAIFASNRFAAIKSTDELTSGSFRPDQITYIIKTHGGRILTSSRYQPTIASLTDYLQNGLTAQEWEPAIFPDTNGPSGILASSAFSVHWEKDQLTEPGGQTSGDGEQTSGDGEQTSGDGFETSGKGLAFSDAVLSDDSSREYQGKKRYGAYATYLAPHSGIGAHRFTLPVPGRKPLVGLPGTAAAPKNLIILDSCYGSDKILSALQYQGETGHNTVVLASVSPLFYHFIDYGALDFSGLLKFPALLERLKQGKNLSAAEKKLADDMTNGTLATNAVQPDPKNKKLTIWAD